ncbi:hypothetical protein B484DRAFT_480896 [Ochromonadaceae sp. CCMP2298]|nr:hypothetical protein B484DRAFT_480896 [Ochromonadaceae sp. CCMP2298]
MTRTGKLILQGGCDYVIGGSKELVDEHGQDLERLFFDAHPRLWDEYLIEQGLSPLEDRNDFPWPGAFINETNYEEVPNVFLVDCTGHIGPCGQPAVDDCNRMAWLLDDQLYKGQWLHGNYNVDRNLRTVRRVGCKSNQFHGHAPSNTAPMLLGTHDREMGRLESLARAEVLRKMKCDARIAERKRQQAWEASQTQARYVKMRRERDEDKGARARAGRLLPAVSYDSPPATTEFESQASTTALPGGDAPLLPPYVLPDRSPVTQPAAAAPDLPDEEETQVQDGQDGPDGPPGPDKSVQTTPLLRREEEEEGLPDLVSSSDDGDCDLAALEDLQLDECICYDAGY